MFFFDKKIQDVCWGEVCGIGSKMKTIAWVEAKNKLPQFGGGAMRELWLFLLKGFENLN